MHHTTKAIAAAVAVVVAAAQPVFACHSAGQDPCEGAPTAEFSDRSAARDAHEPSIDCAAFRFIAFGVTTADGRQEYRPAHLVRRDQMATFIIGMLVAANLENRLPPEDAADRYADVAADNPHRRNINRLAEAGLVSGVGENRYGPGQLLSRQQMATFVVRAVQWAVGDVHTVARDGADRFSDVAPDNVHKQAVEAGADYGLFAGTTATTFSPGLAVRRDQMASFIVSALRASWTPQFGPPNPTVTIHDDSIRAGDQVTGSIDGADVDAASVEGCGVATELQDTNGAAHGLQFAFTVPHTQHRGECTVTFAFTGSQGCYTSNYTRSETLTIEP